MFVERAESYSTDDADDDGPIQRPGGHFPAFDLILIWHISLGALIGSGAAALGGKSQTGHLEITVKLEEFRQSLAANSPPAGLTRSLTALWWDARGDWDKAHSHAQEDEGSSGAWVHAYLHRKEGDRGNAGYWYRRAGKTFCEKSLPEEWLSITQELLSAS